MVKFEGSPSKVKLWTRLAAFPALLMVCLMLAPAVLAQGTSEFLLTTTSLDPVAIAPGGTSSSSVRVDPATGFTGTVALSCQVTGTQATTSTPVCTVSPSTVTPPATPTATITSTTQTTTVGYSVTIAGTGPTTTYSAPALQLTVLAVTPQFTISILNAVAPSTGPPASGAEGNVSGN